MGSGVAQHAALGTTTRVSLAQYRCVQRGAFGVGRPRLVRPSSSTVSRHTPTRRHLAPIAAPGRQWWTEENEETATACQGKEGVNTVTSLDKSGIVVVSVLFVINPADDVLCNFFIL